MQQSTSCGFPTRGRPLAAVAAPLQRHHPLRRRVVTAPSHGGDCGRPSDQARTEPDRRDGCAAAAPLPLENATTERWNRDHRMDLAVVQTQDQQRHHLRNRQRRVRALQSTTTAGLHRGGDARRLQGVVVINCVVQPDGVLGHSCHIAGHDVSTGSAGGRVGAGVAIPARHQDGRAVSRLRVTLEIGFHDPVSSRPPTLSSTPAIPVAIEVDRLRRERALDDGVPF